MRPCLRQPICLAALLQLGGAGMKGMIFTEFFDMVEEVHGLQMAESLIDQTAPASGGIYTAVGDYDYREIVSYAVALSERTGVPLPELLRAFGSWVFERLFVAHYSGFFAEPRSVFEFLSASSRISTWKCESSIPTPSCRVSKPILPRPIRCGSPTARSVRWRTLPWGLFRDALRTIRSRLS